MEELLKALYHSKLNLSMGARTILKILRDGKALNFK